jgi:hypothetical protein
MRHIYATLDAGGVGVFESPTGTVRQRFALFALQRRTRWRRFQTQRLTRARAHAHRARRSACCARR